MAVLKDHINTSQIRFYVQNRDVARNIQTDGGNGSVTLLTTLLSQKQIASKTIENAVHRIVKNQLFCTIARRETLIVFFIITS